MPNGPFSFTSSSPLYLILYYSKEVLRGYESLCNLIVFPVFCDIIIILHLFRLLFPGRPSSCSKQRRLGAAVDAGRSLVFLNHVTFLYWLFTNFPFFIHESVVGIVLNKKVASCDAHHILKIDFLFKILVNQKYFLLFSSVCNHLNYRNA